MSARRTPVDRLILGQREGPDGLILAGWGLLAVFAFLIALASWRFAPHQSVETVTASIPPSSFLSDGDIDMTVTGSIGTSDQPVSVNQRSRPVSIETADDFLDYSDPFSDPVLTTEVAQLRAEVSKLRSEYSDLLDRLAVLEGLPAPITTDPIATGSISGQQTGNQLQITAAPTQTPARIAEPIERSLNDLPPARSIDIPPTQDRASIVIEQTRFGVDVGGFDTLTDARVGWSRLMTNSPDLFSDLTPFTDAVTRADGEPEIRLIAGPYPNLSQAAQTCAALSVLGASCLPVTLEGEELSNTGPTNS